MGYNDQMQRADLSTLIPVPVQEEIIQGVAEDSAVLSLCRRLPNMTSGQQKMPVLASLPAAYFVAEPTQTGLAAGEVKQTSKVTWTYKTLQAEEIAVILPIHKSVLADANYDIWAEIKPKIVEAFGVVIDTAQIVGTNKPASWPAALLTAAAAAGNSVALNSGGVDFADDINACMGCVEEDGFEVRGFLAPVATKAKLRGLRTADGQFIYVNDPKQATPDALHGQRINFIRNGSFSTANAHLIAGDFQQMVYSIRQDLQFDVLTEATIYDPADNSVQYALAQQNMIALRCEMRLGIQLPNPINRMQSVEANRYPFAVIVP
jgi:HK97 family phage major capsid protein